MLLSRALFPSWLSMVTRRARLPNAQRNVSGKYLRRPVYFHLQLQNKEEQDAQSGVGRTQGSTTESGTESTLEFNSFNSDLTCSRSHGTVVARTQLEPKCPPSAHHSVHPFPLLLTQEASQELKRIEKANHHYLLLSQVFCLCLSFYCKNFPVPTSRDIRIMNPIYYQLVTDLFHLYSPLLQDHFETNPRNSIIISF